MEKYTSTIFFVQVKEEDGIKVVPHTGKKYFKFMDKKKAASLLDSAKRNHPALQFRIVKEVTTSLTEDWV